MDKFNCSDICSELEVDYDKKEVRAKAKSYWGEYFVSRGFGVITHYDFEYVKTERVERETIRVIGPCEEIGDFSPEEERHAILHHYEVGLKLWHFYYQNSELKNSSFYFSQQDAFEARRKLKPLIKYLRDFRAGEDFNMFVGEEHLWIGKRTPLDLARLAHYVELPWFGKCSVQVVGSSNPVTHVRLMTERRMSEEEVLPILEYMERTMPTEMYYDDHGYGVLPKPHEVQHFWAFPQGEVHITWDGINRPTSDGLDYVTIELWDIDLLNQTRDEEYWRSEVD